MKPQKTPLQEAWERFTQSMRIPVMVLFSLSVFGLLTFLWVSFGGPVPLRAKPYEVKADFPSAATLATQADVRIAGVSVGKVQGLALDKGDARETATISIDSKYAPLPVDTRAIMRQKTLLGETYIELTPGHPQSGRLPDGAMLSNTQVVPTTSLDEILRALDPPTRRAYQEWTQNSARQIQGSAPQDLSDALGNLAGFAQNGASVLSVLNTQQAALRDVIHNTGVVFGALNERQGQLQQLVLNSDAVFSATSTEQAALADTFRTFPTFLNESKATLARLEGFSRNTDPLVRELQPVADKLTPTLADVSALAPNLQNLFIRLKPVIKASRTDLPQGARFLRGAAPVFDGLQAFLPELNPILTYVNYQQAFLASFMSASAATDHYRVQDSGDGIPRLALGQLGILGGHSFNLNRSVPNWVRANAYDAPNYWPRHVPLGVIESFTCRHTATGGEQRNSSPGSPTDPNNEPQPPCFVAPPQLYSNTQFTFLQRGDIYRKPSPVGTLAGNAPANPNRPLTSGR